MNIRRAAGLRKFWAIAVTVFAPLLSGQGNTVVRAYYDDLGQLSKVVDPNGNVATYSYDATGNIVQVTQGTVTPGSLTIFSITPQRGPIGSTVMIQGQGFSTDPFATHVTFNGQEAPNVNSVTATTLSVLVPSGATTGPIAVRVGVSTAQGSTFTVTPTLVSVTVNPPNAAIAAGAQQQFTATTRFSDNSTQDITASAAWASSAADVASIFSSGSKAGLATGRGAGMSMITASFGGVQSAPAPLTVTPPTVVSIAVTPATFASPPNAEVPYKAMGTLSDQSVKDITTSATWSSSNSTVGTVGNSTGTHGLAITLAIGSTVITAATGSVNGSATLTVTSDAPPPPTFGLGFALIPNSDATISISAVDAVTGQLRTLGYSTTGGTVVSTDSSGQFAYSVGHGSQILGYSINPHTGSLTPTTPVAFGAEASWVTVDPTGRFVFATFPGAAEVRAYAIGTGGALTEISGSPFPTGHGPQSVTIDSSAKFAYVPNGDDGTISAFAINPASGALTPVGGSPYAAGSSPTVAALDGSGRFLYVSNAGSANVSAYVVAPTSGALTPIVGAPFPAGASPVCVASEPTGKFLYVANSSANNVSAYSIDAITGVLTPVTGSPYSVGTQPVSITIDPSGKFVYVLNLNDLTTFTINASSGALTARRTYGVRGNVTYPASMAITRSNTPLTFIPKFIYVANSGDNTISANGIDPINGALTLIPGSPYAVSATAVSITSDPAGRFAYLANQNTNTISAYTVDPGTGVIEPVSKSPFAAGSAPASVAVEASGRFAYAANQGSNNISGYSIVASDGSLTQVQFSPFSAHNGPVFSTVERLGSFLYVANQASNDVSIFVINTSNGRLTASAVPVAAGSSPVSVAVDPTGSFVYVANSLSNNISAYSIVDRSSGGLLPIPGSPFPAGAAPASLTVDVLGNFLYVANASSNSVSGYSIDHDTGALTVLANSPVPTGMKPSAVNVDVSGQFLYVVNAGSNNVSVFSINHVTGALTPVPGSPFPTGSRPMSISSTGAIQ